MRIAGKRRAQSLVSEPKVLLINKQFKALNIHTKESMHQFMLDLWKRTDVTIFMITRIYSSD